MDWTLGERECHQRAGTAEDCQDGDSGAGPKGPRSTRSCAPRPAVMREVGATGAALAPKTLETLAQLQERRPQSRVREIPRKLRTKCLQNAPSGCAPRPGGCTNEMLQVCTDDPEVFHLLIRAAEDCASSSMPETIRKATIVRHHDSSSETRRCGSRHCHGHVFPKTRCEDVGVSVRESGRSNMRFVPIRIVDMSGHGLRRSHIPGSDRCGIHAHSAVHRRYWCL